MPGVAELLGRPGAVALDLGCGVGWSTIALARAYPDLTAVGIDSDEASIMDARRNAAGADLAGRVRFEVARSDAPAAPGSADVVFFFEALHDMAHPVAAAGGRREPPCGPAGASSSSTRTSSTSSPRTGRRSSG